jgi:uncharacterized membrane protein YedE/YeeE
MLILSSLLLGLVFGVGLIISGMTNPAKVIGFLDLAGAWDPSLALVMGAAVAVGLAGFALAGRRASSLLGAPMRLPAARDIDRRLVFGSVAFGIGWGVAGFCPGPALVSLGTGNLKAIVFVLAMLCGMGIYEFLQRTPVAGKQD